MAAPPILRRESPLINHRLTALSSIPELSVAPLALKARGVRVDCPASEIEKGKAMSEEMIRLGRERRFLVLLGIICLALIGGALYMQVVLGEAPCPLCILQRYALLLIAIFAFIGAAMRTRGSITLFETLVVISGLFGVAVAGHHVYTQFYPAVSCGVDVLQPIVDGLPLAKVFPLGFQVDGFCSTPYPPILGLSLAQWALVAFVLVVVLVPVLTRRNRKRLN